MIYNFIDAYDTEHRVDTNLFNFHLAEEELIGTSRFKYFAYIEDEGFEISKSVFSALAGKGVQVF